MKILVAAVTCPAPADNGHRLRSLALLRALAALGHGVELWVCARRDERADPSALARYCQRVRLFPAPPPPSRLAVLFGRQPYARARWRQPHLAAALAAAAGRQDTVIFDTLYAAANWPLASADAAPLVLHAHNVEHRLRALFARLPGPPAARVYAALEALRLRSWEASVARRCRQIWACSQPDAARFRALAPATEVRVAPNVLDLDDYRPKPEGDQELVLFAGGLDWWPNRDAVAYFLRAIWPRVRRCRPRARLLIAGRAGPASACRSRPAAAIEWRHDVADMAEVFAQAAVSVVPLRVASGTRFKILEAAALGRPTVATSVGAEGLGFEAGREILIADRPGEFAAAVVALLSGASRRRAMGMAARRRVERQYGLPCLIAALAAALEQLPRDDPLLPLRAHAAAG